MDADQAVVFIHGLGEGPSAWDGQIAALPYGFTGTAIDLFGDGAAAEEPFSLQGAAERVERELDGRGVPAAHLCGLSLGAMIAFQLAADHPERVRSLTLAAGQVKPPRALMAVQSAIMRLLPERLVAALGTSKAEVLTVLEAVAGTDFSGRLASVSVPTLVLCGSRDRPNLAAARAFAAGMPRAELRILRGAGHQSHLRSPGEFAEALGGFLIRTA